MKVVLGSDFFSSAVTTTASMAKELSVRRIVRGPVFRSADIGKERVTYPKQEVCNTYFPGCTLSMTNRPSLSDTAHRKVPSNPTTAPQTGTFVFASTILPDSVSSFPADANAAFTRNRQHTASKKTDCLVRNFIFVIFGAQRSEEYRSASIPKCDDSQKTAIPNYRYISRCSWF